MRRSKICQVVVTHFIQATILAPCSSAPNGATAAPVCAISKHVVHLAAQVDFLNMQDVGGAHAVFDPLGYESFDESYSILSPKGILAAYGSNEDSITYDGRL